MSSNGLTALSVYNIYIFKSRASFSMSTLFLLPPSRLCSELIVLLCQLEITRVIIGIICVFANNIFSKRRVSLRARARLGSTCAQAKCVVVPEMMMANQCVDIYTRVY